MRLDVIQGQQPVANLQGELLSRLVAGEVLRAQILDFVANEIFLKLMDGTTLTATAAAELNLEKGEFANFSVKENTGNKLILEQIFPAKQSIDENLQGYLKDLKAIGQAATKENIEIVKELKLNNLNLSKELFDATKANFNTKTTIDLPKAVIMAANDLPVNTKNINMLDLLSKGKLQMTSDIKSLLETVEQAIEMNKDVSNSDNRTKQSTVPNKTDVTLKSENNSASHEGKALVSNVSNVTSKMNNQNDDNDFLQKLFALTRDVEGSLNKLSSEELKSTVKANNALDNEQKAPDVKPMTDQGIDKKGVMNDHNRSQVSSEKLLDVKSKLEKLFMNVDELANKRDAEIKPAINEFGSKIQEIAEELRQLQIPNKEVLMQKFDTMQNNLKFINDLSANTCYVQIPVTFNGQNSQAELYVLKRHKNKKINPEDATMLVALDTMNLGRVESLILVNKRTISMNMRVEKSEVADFIRENFIGIYNLLAKKGYKLVDIKYRTIEEPISLLNAHKIANDYMIDSQTKVDIRL